jgi:hypothetical protein
MRTSNSHVLPVMFLLAALTSCFLLAGCLRIPAEGVQLNKRVSERVIQAKDRHVALARGYFRLKKEQLEEWFLSTYEPKYRENFIKLWNETYPNDKFDPSKPEHHRRYVRNSIGAYNQLADELDRAESELVAALEDDYKATAGANDAVGKLLVSAKKNNDMYRAYYEDVAKKAGPAFSLDSIDKKLKQIEEKAMGNVADNRKDGTDDTR